LNLRETPEFFSNSLRRNTVGAKPFDTTLLGFLQMWPDKCINKGEGDKTPELFWRRKL
jgi:hypothetical protein